MARLSFKGDTTLDKSSILNRKVDHEQEERRYEEEKVRPNTFYWYVVLRSFNSGYKSCLATSHFNASSQCIFAFNTSSQMRHGNLNTTRLNIRYSTFLISCKIIQFISENIREDLTRKLLKTRSSGPGTSAP